MLGRITAVLLREWLELRANRTVLLTVLLPPLLFAALPLVALHSGALPYLVATTPQLEELRQALPELHGLDNREALEILLLGQFLALLLLGPLSAALTIASYSIVGEKQRRTLESLLATPIRTWELLLAKTVAAALPGISAGWLGYLVLVLGAGPVLSRQAREYLVGPTGLLVVFVLAPLVSLLGVGLGVLASSRTDDPRAAQQVGVVVVLPILGLLIAQAMGALYLGAAVVLVACGVAALAAAAVQLAAVRIFSREAILSRWK